MTLASHDGDPKAQIAVFDVCDTLYYSNTTHDFVRFVMASEQLSVAKLAFLTVNSRILPFRYALIAYGVYTGNDLLKHYNVSRLKGKTRRELELLSRKFVGEFLAHRPISKTQELFRTLQEAKTQMVLCSSSIEPVVGAVAQHLGVSDYLATKLEYNADSFTGKIAEDITGKKLDAIEQAGFGGRLTVAVSDNWSDKDLLLAADHGIVVSYGGWGEERWTNYSFEMIRV